MRKAGVPPARVFGGDCVELGEGELPTRPSSRHSGRSHAARTLVLDDLPTAARAELGTLLPGLGAGAGQAQSDRDDAAQARLFEALLDALRRARQGPAGGARRSRTSTGPTARRASSSRSSRAACAASACWWWPPTAPTSCTAAIPLRPLLAELERHASARRVELEPLHARRAGRPARRHPRRAARAKTCSTACSRAARATRCSPRSCWPPGPTAAAPCRPRCATR